MYVRPGEYLPSTLACRTDNAFACPGWDSNPHWMVFETMASAVGLPGLTGGQTYRTTDLGVGPDSLAR
jgi:hypothetical protein